MGGFGIPAHACVSMLYVTVYFKINAPYRWIEKIIMTKHVDKERATGM